MFKEEEEEEESDNLVLRICYFDTRRKGLEGRELDPVVQVSIQEESGSSAVK